MDVLTSHRNKRTILLIKENSEDAAQLCKMLADSYNFMVVTELEESISTFRRICDCLSAVLIDSQLPDNACEVFLQRIKKYKKLESIPVLVISTEETVPQKLHYLKLGAVDFVTWPYQKELIVNRISNAVRIKDSATFPELEKMLRALPANIYLKDAEGKYIFATHYWHHLEHDDDPDWTIRGKTDLEIRKDKENAIIAYQSDLQLLRDGKERSYVIEVNADDILEYLQITKAPVRNEKNEITGIIALINNVTEQELLKKKLERQAYIDQMTGLYNRSYYEKYISALMEDNYPLAIISADCNNLKFVNDYYGHMAGDEYIRISASLLKMAFPEPAMIFRTGGDEFLIFMPGASEEEVLKRIKYLQHQVKLFFIMNHPVSIAYGVHVMKDKNQDLMECIHQADKNMYEDKKHYKKES